MKRGCDIVRIVVFGAGVIGRIYAARFSLAGHVVTVVARGKTAQELAAGKLATALSGQPVRRASVSIVTDVRDAGMADLGFIAIRRDQIEAASAAITQIRARVVVSLVDLPVGLDKLGSLVGTDRFVPAFPGVAGSLNSDQVVHFIDVRQQPTAVQIGPNSDEVRRVLQSAGFRTAVVSDMTSWLQAHAVFVSAFESAIVGVDGDLASLASDRRQVHALVLEVRQGLRALAARGIPVEPRSLRLIFLRMPLWFATAYWMRRLRRAARTLRLPPPLVGLPRHRTSRARAGRPVAHRNRHPAVALKHCLPRTGRKTRCAAASAASHPTGGAYWPARPRNAPCPRLVPCTQRIRRQQHRTCRRRTVRSQHTSPRRASPARGSLSDHRSSLPFLGSKMRRSLHVNECRQSLPKSESRVHPGLRETKCRNRFSSPC